MVHGSIEAVDLAQQELFGLILMDMHLSEINGIEASQRIKAASSG
jgi:CheY-like chemotaxis protein